MLRWMSRLSVLAVVMIVCACGPGEGTGGPGSRDVAASMSISEFTVNPPSIPVSSEFSIHWKVAYSAPEGGSYQFYLYLSNKPAEPNDTFIYGRNGVLATYGNDVTFPSAIESGTNGYSMTLETDRGKKDIDISNRDLNQPLYFTLKTCIFDSNARDVCDTKTVQFSIQGATQTPTSLSAPTGVSAAAGDGEATISWNSVSGTASYNVYRSTSSSVSKTNGTKITGATSPYTISGLTNGTTYYFVVTAVNSEGESPASSRVSATPSAVVAIPAAPTNVSAEAGNGKVTVGWDSSAGATSYNIYISTSSGVSKTDGTKTAGVSSPYSVTGLTNGATYYFVVTAVNSIGESEESSEVSASPAAPLTPPSAPTGVGSVAGDGQVTVSWNDVSGATSYNTYWSTTWNVSKSNGTKIADVTSPYDVTGLTNGTTYYFVVTAVNNEGESSDSYYTHKAPIEPTRPYAPSGVEVVAGNGEATVSWNSVSGATTYHIYWNLSEDTTKTKIDDVASPYTVTGLANGEKYFFGVTAANRAGESTESSLVYAIPSSSNAVVTTFAGSGTSGSNDGAAATARFYGPREITSDGANLYVTDYYNHTIRKIVISTGEVSTLAGLAGSSGSSDGIGSAARFRNPIGITNDDINLYVADYGNRTIRKIVISTGEVTTLAGLAGSSGFADGIGATARFGVLEGIATDRTNLYVTDSYWDGGTIRKIVISTGEVTTLAGQAGTPGSSDGIGSVARFRNPIGITNDGINLYVADYGNRTIRKLVISTGEVTTLAGLVDSSGFADGIGAAAIFNRPAGITTDGTNIYVADYGTYWDDYGCTIRKIVLSTSEVTTLAGQAGTPGSSDGTGPAARFYAPHGIYSDGTKLYVADFGNNTIRKISGFTSVPTLQQ